MAGKQNSFVGEENSYRARIRAHTHRTPFSHCPKDQAYILKVPSPPESAYKLLYGTLKTQIIVEQKSVGTLLGDHHMSINSHHPCYVIVSCYDKTQNRSNIREEEFIWAHSLRVPPFMAGTQDSRSPRQLGA